MRRPNITVNATEEQVVEAVKTSLHLPQPLPLASLQAYAGFDVEDFNALCLKNKREITQRRWASRIPIITTMLLESANLSQIIRMVTERSARGQSILSWLLVVIALLLWSYYFRVITPKEKIALWSTYLGVVINSIVLGCVIYFRVRGR